MAIKGRTQLSIHITDEHHDIFNQIKEETGLSNAKIVEMLIDSYAIQTKTTSTTIKPTKTTSTKSKPEQTTKYVTEERVKELIQEALSSQLTTEETEEEKEKKKVAALVAQYTDENGNFDTEATCTSIDTSPPIPEWDEQAWLDEDFIEFSNDPNPPEIIRTKPVEKAPIEDEDDDW
jgi:post-segregation antitoxin (ccd killing protein)